MSQNARHKLFDEYFDSSYKHGNLLTSGQLDIAAEYFARDYQGLLPENKEAAILDVGSGTGDFLFFLKQQGYRNFLGIDISAQQVAYCKQNVSDRVEAANASDYLPDKRESFDLITAHDVLEHIPKEEILNFLRLIFQSLKPGGSLILRVPNMSNPFGLDARFNDFTHEIGFTAKSLYQVLWLAGFRQIEILGPRKIPVRSLRHWVRKCLVRLLHQTIRFCCYIQDYAVPSHLDKNLVVVAKK